LAASLPAPDIAVSVVRLYAKSNGLPCCFNVLPFGFVIGLGLTSLQQNLSLNIQYICVVFN